MRFFSIKKLREEIIQDGAKDKDVMKYITWYYSLALIFGPLLVFALSGIGHDAPDTFMVSLTALRGVFSFMMALYMLVGLYYVYRKNYGAEGKKFMNRLIPVMWVTYWRYLFMGLIPVGLLIGIGIGLLPSSTVPGDALFDNAATTGTGIEMVGHGFLITAGVIALGLFLTYWWRVGIHVRRIADSDKS